MNLATPFFQNRHLLWLTTGLVLVAGLSTLLTIPRTEDPVIVNRNPVVLTPAPGLNPEVIEALIAIPLEDALRELDVVKTVQMTLRPGFLVTAVELLDSIKADTAESALSRVRDAVRRAEGQFPPEARPSIVSDTRGAVAQTLIVALKPPSEEPASLVVAQRVAEELASAFRQVSGTDFAEVLAGVEEEIRVTASAGDLAALGMTIPELAQALALADAKRPAGRLSSSQREAQLRVSGEFLTLDAVAEVVLRAPDTSSEVAVADVATVERTVAEPLRVWGLSGGQRAIYVAATVLSNQRVDLWTTAIEKVVAETAALYGGSVGVEVIFRQNDYTAARLGELGSNLVLGAAVVALVVFFTMGWRSSLVVSAAIPLTAAATLFTLSILGGKLHQMSIFGMILALGLLIDNAIIVVDEVTRLLRRGVGRMEAVGQTFHHLLGPLTASTLTTILSFMPIVLLPGNGGDFVGPIGLSVALALISSLLISLTVILALAAIFGESKTLQGGSWNPPAGTSVAYRRADAEPGEEPRATAAMDRAPPSQMDVEGAGLAARHSFWRDGLGGPWLAQRGQSVLGWSLRHRWITVGLSAVAPLAGFWLASTLGVQFFPRADRDMFEVRVWLQDEASLAATIKAVSQVDGRLRADPAIEEVHWLAGASFPPVYYNMVGNQDDTPYFAQGVVRARSFQEVDALVADWQAKINQELPGVQFLVRKFAQGPPAEADIEFRLVGPDWETLRAQGEVIQAQLAAHPDVIHSRASLRPTTLAVTFQPDDRSLVSLGLDRASVAQQLEGALTGLPGGTLVEGVSAVPVRVRLADRNRETIADLAAVTLSAPAVDGRLLPLEALGELRPVAQAGTLVRRNGQRVNTVQAWVRFDALPIGATSSVQARLAEMGFRLPEGYRLEIGGESEQQGDSVGDLFKFLPILIVLGVATLILTFRSVVIGGLLGSVGFLSVGYGLLATALMGFPLSFNTFLGIFALIGLTFNGSIMVMAGILGDEAAAGGDRAAMARRTQEAMRHLISTTLTTVGSFLPLLILVGGDFWPPLAIVLAGGVLGSTLLAIFYTPALFALLPKPKSPGPS